MFVEKTIGGIAQIHAADAVFATSAAVAQLNIGAIAAKLRKKAFIATPAIDALVTVLAMIDAVTVDAVQAEQRKITEVNMLAIGHPRGHVCILCIDAK